MYGVGQIGKNIKILKGHNFEQFAQLVFLLSHTMPLSSNHIHTKFSQNIFNSVGGESRPEKLLWNDGGTYKKTDNTINNHELSFFLETDGINII